jgi:hypothetical protein
MRRRRSLVAESLEPRALLSSLSYSLTTDRPVYQVGQPIQFTFRETNIGTQPVTVQVAPGDFTVWTNSSSIWQSNPGVASQPPKTEILKPGQSVSQTAIWHGTTSHAAGPTGSAILQINNFGTFTVSNPNSPQGVRATFQITDPLTFSLTTDKQVYQPGEPVQATFTEVNTASQPITMLPLPFMAFDVYQNGKPLWWNSYPMIINTTPIVLAPGQKITDTQTLMIPQGSGSAAGNTLNGTFEATYGPGSDPTEFSTPFQIVAAASDPPPTMPPVTLPPTMPPVTLPPTMPPITLPPTMPPVTLPPTMPPVTLPPTTPPISSPVIATLVPNHVVYKSGHPVRLSLTLTNTTGTKVALVPRPGVDGITVMHGSAVVYHSSTAASALAPGSIKPHGSVKLTFFWSGRPNQSGLKKLPPGTYTIQVVEAGYTATTTIRIG